MNRIDWRSYAMALAFMARMRSEARSTTPDGDLIPRKVGCCVLAKNNHVLAMGYNGFIPGYTPPPDFYKDPTKRFTHIIHSETNALVNVRRGEASLIAITLSPCASCAQQIIAREIPLVIYGEEYKDTTGLDILKSFGVETVFLSLMNVMTDWIVPGVEEFLTLSK